MDQQKRASEEALDSPVRLFWLPGTQDDIAIRGIEERGGASGSREFAPPGGCSARLHDHTLLPRTKRFCHGTPRHDGEPAQKRQGEVGQRFVNSSRHKEGTGHSSDQSRAAPQKNTHSKHK